MEVGDVGEEGREEETENRGGKSMTGAEDGVGGFKA
jgi:hypothetical protein